MTNPPGAPSTGGSAAAPSIGTPRDRARAQTLLDITRIGRDHLTRDGAAALSLRAVARDLGVVSSAVYRYVASRDDLLTLLVVDAFTELADAVDLAVSQADSSPRSRLDALASAMRAWAVREPARWSLLYGSPVPGYQAPAEQTTEPGIRVMATFVGIVDEAYAAGRIAGPASTRLGRALRTDLKSMAAEVGATVPEPVLARGALWWASLVGVISSEVFGHFGAETFSEPDALFAHHLGVLDEALGITA